MTVQKTNVKPKIKTLKQKQTLLTGDKRYSTDTTNGQQVSPPSMYCGQILLYFIFYSQIVLFLMVFLNAFAFSHLIAFPDWAEFL